MTLKNIIQSLSLADVILGLVLLNFKPRQKIPLSEVYRILGSQFSISKDIIRASLILFSDNRIIRLQTLGRTPFLVLEVDLNEV